MKLPRAGTRRFKVLRCFIGKRMNVTDLIANFGQFNFETRSHLATELRVLHELGCLCASKGEYWITAEIEAALLAMGEEEAEIVPPRQYNVFAAPPLSKKHIPSLEPRRPNCLDVRVPTRYVASDAIPVSEIE